MAKDYTSFASASKSRFRNMAKELDYKQITGIVYAKKRDGWYEHFFLQASQYGNDFFYINYGVVIPNLWYPFDDKIINLKNEGQFFSYRLFNSDSQTFKNGTKLEIEESAKIALKSYKKQALPVFEKVELKNIASQYYESTNIRDEELESLSYYSQIPAANYGFLLLRSGQDDEALKWLIAAEKLMALPVYFTRNGKIVHEKEKYARISKPEDYEVEQLQSIRYAIKKIKNGTKLV